MTETWRTGSGSCLSRPYPQVFIAVCVVLCTLSDEIGKRNSRPDNHSERLRNENTPSPRDVDLHSFFADPDQAVFLNVDPDLDPAAFKIRIQIQL